MAVTTGTTTTAQFSVAVKEIDFVSKFETNWDALRAIMGIARPIVKPEGADLVANKVSVTLQSGTVAEGDEVPLSQATVTPVTIEKIVMQKYRKRVTAEAVQNYGAALAVQKTDDALLAEITGTIMDKFYTFAQTGTLTSNEATFQMALAMAITKAKDKFKKAHLNYTSIVAFVNTIDIGRYLGGTEITVQTMNGVEYLKNFLGADTVIITSEIPEGTVIATPADNIVMYYIDPASYGMKELGLEYTTGNAPTNLIGVHKEGVYGRVAGDTHAICGVTLFAEYLDGIAVVKVTA